MNKFYYSSDNSGANKILKGVPVLISTASCFKRGKFILPSGLNGASDIILDSGGFVCFTKWNDYPFTCGDYISWVSDFIEMYPQTTRVSIMDLPCEPKVSGRHNNFVRIHQTLQNTKFLLKERDIPWMSVVQGYSLAEYRYCMESMLTERLYTPVTAIGSICQRKGTKHLLEIIKTVTGFNPTVKYHSFGLQLQSLRKCKDLLYSSDSGAWKFGNNNKGFFPRTLNDKILNFHKYSLKINEQIIGDFRYRNLSEGICS